MTSTLNLEGEAVRVSIGNGSFLHGDVQEVNAEQVKVRGRWFPLSVVQTEEEVEQFMKANIAEDRRRSRAEQEAKEAAARVTSLAAENKPKRVFRFEQGIAYKPTGAEKYEDFVALLNSTGFKLWAEAQTSEDIARCYINYSEWSAGDSLPEENVAHYPNRTNPVEWRLTFPFTENYAYPFPIIEAGAQGKRPCGNGVPVGILSGSRVTLNYVAEVEKLVRAGLRA